MAWAVTPLDFPISPSSPAFAFATAASQDGSIIVGEANRSIVATSACYWLKSDSSITMLASPGSLLADVAYGCSDDGSIIVGSSHSTGTVRDQATTWTTGTPVAMESNPATSSYRLLLAGGASYDPITVGFESGATPGFPNSFNTGLFSWWTFGNKQNVSFIGLSPFGDVSASQSLIHVFYTWSGTPSITVELVSSSVQTFTYDIPAYIVHTATDGMLLHLAVAFDMAANTIQVYLQREALTPTSSGWITVLPMDGSGYLLTDVTGTKFVGDIWFGDTVSLFDLSVTSNLNKLIDINCQPVDLGANGENVTGSSPQVFLHCNSSADDLQTNFGTGGSWGIYDASSQPPGATFTGSLGATFIGTAGSPATHLTVSGTAGVISIGDTISGTGVPANTSIISQSSGTPGGDGVYVTNNATTSSGDSLTATSKLLQITAIIGGTLASGQLLTAPGITNAVISSVPIGVGVGLIDGAPQLFLSGQMFAMDAVSLTGKSVTYSSQALGCSGDGSVVVGFVGYGRPSPGIFQNIAGSNYPLPAVWVSGGNPTVLDGWAGTKPGYGYAEAMAVTQDGSIAVGFAADDSDPVAANVQPVYWTISDGHLHTLTSLSGGSDWDIALAVANSGTVVCGTEQDAADSFNTPIVWTSGTPAALPGLPSNSDGYLGTCTGISGAGSRVSGYGDDSSGVGTALVWDSGAITALPFLNLSDEAAAAFGVARDGSIIVGQSQQAFPSPGTNTAVFWSEVGGVVASIGETYFAAAPSFYDLSIPANRAKFHDASGNPVDLGVGAKNPTGVAPAVFLSRQGGPPADFATNVGTGGSFTVSGGTLDDAGSITGS